MYQAARQPGQADIQSLLGLYNAGKLVQAEMLAKSMLSHFPNELMIHNVLGVCLEGQKKFEEAAACYRRMIGLNGKVAEFHFNLGASLSNLGRFEEAIASYRKAIALKPNLVVAYFNLGTALQALRRLEEATASYRKAVAIDPGFYEALGNLGTVLQEQGRLEEAIGCYRQALAVYPDAKGHYNLGTALRNQGHLDEAITLFKRALELKPDYADAYSSMGVALWDQGNPNAAVESYHHALAIDPNHGDANYNMGVFLYDHGELEQAIPYFETSRTGDWQERVLYCLYKTRRFDEFELKLDPLLASKNVSPFLATLSTHYAENFGKEDRYNYCKNPMEFVYHDRIEPLAAENSQLLKDLLHDITLTDIAERKQGRLYYGIQSSGNLLKRSEASFKLLASLIKDKIKSYRKHYTSKDCELIKSFPTDVEFSSSWYLRMRQGGHLTSHIHEEGWISGCVYLALPKQKETPHEGSIEFSTDGDEYPKEHDNFPSKVIDPSVGDIVLFPSSLFHRTIPFSSDEDRVCVAFDLKPLQSIKALLVVALGWLSLFVSEAVEFVLAESYLLA
jgi:uncharacterized protein (TIGR02466 family)